MSHIGPKNLSRTCVPEHYVVYGRPNQIPSKWPRFLSFFLSLGSKTQPNQWTVLFVLFCRHKARPPITSGVFTGGYSNKEARKHLARRHSRIGPWTRRQELMIAVFREVSVASSEVPYTMEGTAGDKL